MKKTAQGIPSLDRRQRNTRTPSATRPPACIDGHEHRDRWDPVRGRYECTACKAWRSP